MKDVLVHVGMTIVVIAVLRVVGGHLGLNLDPTAWISDSADWVIATASDVYGFVFEGESTRR